MKYRPEIVTAYFRSQGLPTPEYEYMHVPGRKFRADIAWPKHKVAVEVMGGLWIAGGHSRGAGVRKDMDRRNLVTLAGWRVIEVEPKDLCTLDTVRMLKELLYGKQEGKETT